MCISTLEAVKQKKKRLYMHILGIRVEKKKKKNEVLPRLELGSLDSKSKVLTITPQDRPHQQQ